MEFREDPAKLQADYEIKIDEAVRLQKLQSSYVATMQDGYPPELSGGSYTPLTMIPMAGLPISTPSGSRGTYQWNCILALRGTDIRTNPSFTQLNPERFNVSMQAGNIGCGYIRKELAYYLELLYNQVASRLGISRLAICSSYRSEDYNNKLYDRLIAQDGRKRVTNSAHIAGLAVDISLEGTNRYLVADLAWNMGFGGIAIGRGFVHVDISAKGTWTYPGVPEYKGPGRWNG